MKIFHGIINHLEFLYQNDDWDGEVRNSIRIATRWVQVGTKSIPLVRVNFVDHPRGLNAADCMSGIFKDLNDMRSMMNDVDCFPGNPHRIRLLTHVFLNDSIYKDPPTTLAGAKRLALFNFSRSVFLHDAGACRLVFRLAKLRARNPRTFDFLMRMNQPQAFMADWMGQLPLSNAYVADGQSILRRLLYDRKGPIPQLHCRFGRFKAVDAYFRSVLIHGRD